MVVIVKSVGDLLRILFRPNHPEGELSITVGSSDVPCLVTSINVNRHVSPTSFVVHAITPKHLTPKEKTDEEFKLKG